MNIILISNEKIGINGAAIGNIICNFTVCTIGFVFLKKTINLKIDIKKCILKPIFATLIMSCIAIIINFLLKSIITEKLATIVSIATAAGCYGALVVALKLIKT